MGAFDTSDMTTAKRHSALRGRRVVLDRYNWDVLADKLERVWRDCMRGCD